MLIKALSLCMGFDLGHYSSLQAGDLILADKGFMIHDLVPKDVFLNLPPFLARKSQFTKEEAIFCRKIEN